MDWIPALSSTSLLVVVVFLFRNVITTRLTNAIKHEYDNKFELFKADLLRKEKDIDSIRQVGLSGLQQRQEALFKKQIESVELLWAATCKVYMGKPLSEMMLRVKTEEVSKSIKSDEKLQQFFRYISMHVDMEKMASVDPQPARPFVSKLAWAYYSAYSSILWHYVLQAKMFETGLSDNLLETEKLTKLVSVALPHQSEFIQQYGVSAFGHLLDELQENILQELESMLNGKTLDTDGLEKAAEIQNLAHELSEKNKDLSKQAGGKFP